MHLIKEGGVYKARFRTNPPGSGKPKWRKVTTHQTVISEAKKVVDQSGIAALERCLKPFEEYMQGAANSSRTANSYIMQLKLWLDAIKLHSLNPSAIEPKHIAKWVNAKDAGALGTRKYKLAVIKTFFNFLLAKGWTMANPAALVRIDFDAMSHEEKEKKVITPLSDDQVDTLLARSDDPFWRFATLCARENALRLADVCNLEWPSFAVPGKLIVWTGKRDKRLELDMSARLTGLLAGVPVTDPKYVFPEQRRVINSEKKRALLSTQFSRLCARCGFKGNFHMLRHTAATEVANKEAADILELVQEIGLEKARKLLGHTSKSTTKGYVH